MFFSFSPKVNHRQDYHESANEATPERTSAESAYRLQRRYRYLDFDQCFTEICIYLKNRLRLATNPKEKMQLEAAQRAIYPNFGAVGTNRRGVVCTIPNLELVAYYWMAASDESTDILSSVSDRRACFARALYECQRANNNLGDGYENRNSPLIDFTDDGNPEDKTACPKGVTVKFAEVMVGMHPDVDLVTDLQPRILDLLRGFLAEYFIKTLKIPVTDLHPTHGKDLNYAELTPEAIREDIKAKITRILGVFSRCAPFLMSFTDLKYLSDCVNNLEYFEFTAINKNHAFEEYIQKLIVDANQQLTYINESTGSWVSGTFTRLNKPRFNQATASNILIAELPKPTNQCDIILNDIGLSTLVVLAGTVHSIGIQDRTYTASTDARIAARIARRNAVGW